MIRKFLHWFDIHYWSRWSDPVLMDTCYTVQHLAQERTCSICNKTERNVIL